MTAGTNFAKINSTVTYLKLQQKVSATSVVLLKVNVGSDLTAG